MCLPFHVPPSPLHPRDSTQPEPAREAAAQDSPQDMLLQLGGLKQTVPGPMIGSEFPFCLPSPAPCLYALMHLTAFSRPPLPWQLRFSDPTQGSGPSAPGEGCMGEVRMAGAWEASRTALGQPSPDPSAASEPKLSLALVAAWRTCISPGNVEWSSPCPPPERPPERSSVMRMAIGLSGGIEPGA